MPTHPALAPAIERLPKEPGVYRFLNREQEVIYVGKAKSLKNRVSSYFNASAQHNRKTLRMLAEVEGLEFTVVDTESDALLLENNLIKELQPRYNILLKDDKTYPYLCVTNEPFPRLFPTRRIADRRHAYFGPYASVRNMNAMLELIRKLYTIRTCRLPLAEESIRAGKFKVCLEYHIKNCQGPCEALQSQANYQQDMEQVKNLLKGRLNPVRDHFKAQMQEAAVRLDFETAQQFKEKLDLLAGFQNKSMVANPSVTDLEVFTITSDEARAWVNYMKVMNGCIIQTRSVEVRKRLISETDWDILAYTILATREKLGQDTHRILTNVEPEQELPGLDIKVPRIGDLRKLLELSLKNALYYRNDRKNAELARQNAKGKNRTLIQLKTDLNLPTLPRHIECFDNSNIQGTNPVAAMVCFKEGKPSKADYRKYHIKTVEGPNDFASMYEVVHRRYARLLEEEQPLPDLIVVDGGKGQLSMACQALKDLGIYGQTPVIGIAKRLEEIYFPDDPYPVHISKKSPSLLLIQRLRNEAHRFAITFHRQKRSANSLKTGLSEVKGIGKATVEKLLTGFESFKSIKEASIEELAKVVGTDKAMKVHAYFHPEQTASPSDPSANA